jgi:hypothetical protein
MWPKFVLLSLCEAKRCHLLGPIYLGARWIEISSVERSCEMPSMNDDAPARDAEGQTSFYGIYTEKTAQLLYAQLGSKQSMASLYIVPRQLEEEIPR